MNCPKRVAALLQSYWLRQTFNYLKKKAASQIKIKIPRNHIKDNRSFAVAYIAINCCEKNVIILENWHQTPLHFLHKTYLQTVQM